MYVILQGQKSATCIEIKYSDVRTKMDGCVNNMEGKNRNTWKVSFVFC